MTQPYAGLQTGYEGTRFQFPLGTAGLRTDDANKDIPPDHLTAASNVVARNGVIELTPGAIKWNQVAYPAGVVATYDYFPTPNQQRQISVCADGNVYLQINGYLGYVVVTPVNGAPTTLTISPEKQVHIVEGGKENNAATKRLYIFSGNDPVQVIDAAETTRRNLSNPADDWALDSDIQDGTQDSNWPASQNTPNENQPIFGFIYQSRLCVLGGGANAHRLYMSTVSSQEDFHTTTGGDQPQFFSIDPGQQDGLSSALVMQGRLFVFKQPYGIYYLDDTAGSQVSESSPALPWFFRELNKSFGIASPHSAVGVLSDVLIANYAGSITSLQAVFQLGDVKAADLLTDMRCDQFFRSVLSPKGTYRRYALYYEDQKKVFFACQGAGSVTNDKIIEIDVSQVSNGKVFYHEAFQANCLANRRDIQGIQRPVYGSNDGFIYIMDRPDRNVGGVGYDASFTTVHSPCNVDMVKLFDYIELSYESTGKWNISFDIYIDGTYSQTVQAPSVINNPLDIMKLDKERLAGRPSRSFVVPIRGSGRRIGIQCYIGSNGQNFKVESLSVYYRMAGDNQKAANLK